MSHFGATQIENIRFINVVCW